MKSRARRDHLTTQAARASWRKRISRGLIRALTLGLLAMPAAILIGRLADLGGIP